MTNMTAEDRITKARVSIMKDKRFIGYAGILMHGTWEVDDDMPTAATTGTHVIYGRKFIDAASDALVRFVVLHEYMHNILMHMTNLRHLFKQEPRIANLAADTVINNMLDNLAGKKADDFLEIWEHAILDHQYDDMSTIEVFEAYMKQAQQQPKGGKGKPGKGQGKPSAGGGEAQDFDQHDAKGEAEGGLTEKQVKELQHQIDSALRQGAQIAGRTGAQMDRSITDLLEVTVPWQEVLVDFVKTHCKGDDMATWRRLSRRWMARDICQPSRYSESVKRVTIGTDTSGSITQMQLRRAMTEMAGAFEVVKPEMVDVIYWDYDVAGHEVYEGDNIQQIAQVTKPKGGGGTRVGSMKKFMQDKDIKPECIIIFTDGYVEQDWGGSDWPAPVLWCISTKGIVAPHGKSLYVPAN